MDLGNKVNVLESSLYIFIVFNLSNFFAKFVIVELNNI